MSKIVPGFGPAKARLVIVGEAPGQEEVKQGQPFVGASGRLLDEALAEAEISRAECYITNVFKKRPPENKLADYWCAPKKEMPAGYSAQPLFTGAYVKPEHLPDLPALHEEILSREPNLVLLLGGTALWAFGRAGINKHRGSVFVENGQKFLPTFHPAGVMRQWNQKPIFEADIYKAAVEMESSETNFPNRMLWIEPSFADVEHYLFRCSQCLGHLAFDIETRGRLITCISVAIAPHESMCIPFYDRRKPDGNYWPHEEERMIWRALRWLLNAHKVITQNGMYDIQYLATHGCKIRRNDDDTMLLHHSLYPEVQKSLGFLASIYTNEQSWKDMVKTLEKEK